MSDEEIKPEEQAPAPAVVSIKLDPPIVADEVTKVVIVPAPAKPPAPLGRNGRPIISRHYAPLILAFALLLPMVGCAGTAAGNELNRMAGIKATVNPDGSTTYEKLPSSPIQDTGSLFGPMGGMLATLFTLGVYGIRQLGNSVPKDSHDKALNGSGPGEKV